jgi:hypothetical protein
LDEQDIALWSEFLIHAAVDTMNSDEESNADGEGQAVADFGMLQLQSFDDL